MDNAPKDEDFLRLHALVDGELAPAERAEMAGKLAADRDLARAHATLAQLKATIADGAAEAPAFILPKRRRTNVWRAAVAAACLVALTGLAFWGANAVMPEHGSAIVTAEGPTAITLASLPAGTSIPRLDSAGLKLIGLAIDPGHVPLVTATYRGPHGCRLDLRAWPEGAEPPPLTGSIRARWTAGGLTYELVAHGMPQWRFAIIADGAEQQTRAGSDPAHAERRLREANNRAPPCLG